jgi:mannose-6-phosphate isomerase-like protein (cupin superfamily)
MRRVATGHTPDGKAIFASDTEVDSVTVPTPSGSELFRAYIIWEANETPVFPDDGSPQALRTRYPAAGGFRFGILTFPPHTDVGGMHITDTVDLYYIMSGEVWLELDDGNERLIRAGETLVQNGTRHAWHNRGAEPCRMVSCMIGAHRSHLETWLDG